MIEFAKINGTLGGGGGHRIPGGVTRLQCADDTLLLIEKRDDYIIINLKFILYCFEAMSGLKINYHKSAVYVFGRGNSDQERIANMFNCKLETLP